MEFDTNASKPAAAVDFNVLSASHFGVRSNRRNLIYNIHRDRRSLSQVSRAFKSGIRKHSCGNLHADISNRTVASFLSENPSQQVRHANT